MWTEEEKPSVAALRARRCLSSTGSMPWLTSFERRSASSRADAGVQGLPSFPMVHRLVFAPRPPRRYWKMNDFAPEGVTFSPKPCNSSSQRRSEEHTSELQSLMRISYAVFCLHQK